MSDGMRPSARHLTRALQNVLSASVDSQRKLQSEDWVLECPIYDLRAAGSSPSFPYRTFRYGESHRVSGPVSLPEVQIFIQHLLSAGLTG